MFRKQIVIFGAGKAGRDALPLLKEDFEIVAFSDNDPGLWGQKIQGIKIISPALLDSERFNFIVIASTFWREIEDNLINNYRIPKDRIEVYPLELLHSERRLNVRPVNYIDWRPISVMMLFITVFCLGVVKILELTLGFF